MWRVFAALTSFLCQESCYITSQIDLSFNGRSYCHDTSEQNILVMDPNRISPPGSVWNSHSKSITTIEKRGAI